MLNSIDSAYRAEEKGSSENHWAVFAYVSCKDKL